MKIIVLTIFLFLFSSLPTLYAQNGLHLVGHLDQKHSSVSGGWSYNGCWGYVAPDGREYAILGTSTGTAIIEITDTANIHEIVHIPGPTSIWREMRTFRDRLYVVTENGGGTQIIDLSALPDTATLIKSFTYTNGAQHTANAHTIEIFDGYMYLNGCSGWGTTAQRGVVIFSLSDADNPQYAGEYTPNYFHDSYVRNDTLFGASVYSTGGIYIADIKNKSAPVPIGKISYAGSGTHSVWTTKDGRYVISADEIGTTEKSLKFWDLQGLPSVPSSPTSTYVFNGLGDIEHNVVVRGDYAYTAWYTAGTVVVDVADPSAPVTAGWYDSSNDILFPPGNYDGVWAVYPYFWSGKIVAGDMENGLFVFTFDSLKPRTPASLLAPADGTTSCDPSPMTFRWTRVADPARDPHVYQVRVTGPGVDTTIHAGADTSVAVDPDALGFGTFHWSVVTKDEANAVATQDTFVLNHPWRHPIVLSPNGAEVLKTGSIAPITWSSNCLDSVEISYSTNGGETWTIIAESVPALPASYGWTVPATPTTHGKIRIRNAADSASADDSDAEFTLYNSHSLTLLSPNGGEIWQSGTYHDVRWVGGLVTRVGLDYTLDGGATWSSIASDTSASVGTLSWLVPDASTTTASVRVVDLDNASVVDQSDTYLTIWPMAIDLNESWNLVSFPGVPSDRDAAANFPGTASGPFSYSGAYVRKDSIKSAEGYWVKYGSARSIPLNGAPTSADTAEVGERWNMIGGPSVPVSVSALVSIPGSMTLSALYGYGPDSGYYAADSIRPGRGYWVKVSEGGQIVLSSLPAPLSNAPKSVQPEGAAVFRDATGKTRRLFLGHDGTELPPPPPVGMFDVRFASQRNAEIIGRGGAEIELRSAAYPVSISVSGSLTGRYSLVERVRGKMQSSYELSAGETIIRSKPAGALFIESSAQGAEPERFELHQNWPNPFNPVTTITFDLLFESKVSLTVYTLLGSEVATLVDGILAPGSHVVQFDARDLPSGVYLCRLRTAAGTEMRKMVLAR